MKGCEVYRTSKLKERQEKWLKILVGNLRGRDHLGYIGVDKRTVLEYGV
jgi:hypothetical protein